MLQEMTYSLNSTDWKFNLFDLIWFSIFLRLFLGAKRIRLKINPALDWNENQSKKSYFSIKTHAQLILFRPSQMSKCCGNKYHSTFKLNRANLFIHWYDEKPQKKQKNMCCYWILLAGGKFSYADGLIEYKIFA